MNAITKSPTWLDKTEYPFEHKTIQLTTGTMHYVDEGEGKAILFVHGTPTWSFLYRDFIKGLSDEYRTIAVDHIGFGLSEKPEDFAGRPEDHTMNLNEFIEKLNLTDITLVVHDFGGPIGLASAIEQPERFQKIVLFNTWLWETEPNEEVRKINKVVNSFIGRLLYLRLNFSPRVLLKKGFADSSHLTKNTHKHYLKPFPDKSSRYGTYRLAQAVLGSSDWYQSQWESLDVLVQKPWMVLWGMEDNFLSSDFLQKWKQRLPYADIHRLNCGHFVQEEKLSEAISLIRNFLT